MTRMPNNSKHSANAITNPVSKKKKKSKFDKKKCQKNVLQIQNKRNTKIKFVKSEKEMFIN